MTDWTAFNASGTPNTPTITGGFNLNYSDIIALGTPHIYADVFSYGLYNILFASVQTFAFGINYQNGTSFYQSMYPTSTYVNGVSAILALDFRGIGLARSLYLGFVDMLYQITNS
jgi:hypothetical protein